MIRLWSAGLFSFALIVGMLDGQDAPPHPRNDGFQVRVSHILISTNNLSDDEAKTRIEAIKKHIDSSVAAALANRDAGLPPVVAPHKTLTPQVVELRKAFAAAAKESECPSKIQGGDVGWFSRRGVVIEQFAEAAFALKLHEMSEPVRTKFGYHLILKTDQRTLEKNGPAKEPFTGSTR